MKSIKIFLVLLLLLFSINISSGIGTYPDFGINSLELNSPYIMEYPFTESAFPETNITVIEQAILNEMRPVEIENNESVWEINGLYFESVLKNSANDNETWSYIENDKDIAFTYEKMQWDNDEEFFSSINPSIAVLNDETSPVSLTYPNAISDGINIKIIQDNYQWQKIVEIESLASLGDIPVDAEYLEISFKVSGDFTLPNGIIAEPIPIGENSFIHPVKAWDSQEDYESGAAGVITGDIVTKQIPVEWLKSASYPVQTDLMITYGVESTFNAGSTESISVAMFDSTRFVVAYQDGDDSSHGKAIVGEVSGTTITYGAENAFNLEYTSCISIAVLDNTHFVVAYSNISSHGIAIVGTVSGTTITSYGAANTFNAGGTSYIYATALDNTHFVVAYSDNSDYGVAIVGTVSGTTITSYGAANTFNADNTYFKSVAALDNTHFIVTYCSFGGSFGGFGRVGAVSGTTITYGSASAFNTATTVEASVAILDSSRFVVAYQDSDGSGDAKIGTVSGTTITSYGAANVFKTTAGTISVITLSSSNFVVSYKGTSNQGTAIVGDVSGTVITSYGAENIFNAAHTLCICIAGLDSNHFVVAYREQAGPYHGNAIVGLTFSNTAPVTSSLKTEGETNPTQILTNISAPYFTWTYFDANSDTQTHWEIWVGTSSGASDMWNSGQLTGTDTSDIYAGSALSRGTTYYLRVRTRDGTDWGNWATGTFRINALPAFANDTISPSVVTEGELFTVSVNITDSDGTISDAIVKIDDTNYTLINTVDDVWSYDYLDAALGTYYITDFYAQDNSGEWSSTFSALNITVISPEVEEGVAAYYSTTYNEPAVVGEDEIEDGGIIVDTKAAINNIIEEIIELSEKTTTFISTNLLLVIFIIIVIGFASYVILDYSRKEK